MTAKLQIIGNAALIDRTDKVAFLSSRRISPADMLKCYEWAEKVRMFIEFMLTALRDALVAVKKSVGKSGKKSDKKILEHLKDNPSATLDELQELTGLSSGGIRKAIRRLKDAKLLRRVGPDKGGHWEVLGGKGVKRMIEGQAPLVE